MTKPDASSRFLPCRVSMQATARHLSAVPLDRRRESTFPIRSNGTLSPMRVLCAGARPNFMKVKPVIDALEGRGSSLVLVDTQQHYDDSMNAVFLRELGLRDPDVTLGTGSGTHAQQTARVMERRRRASPYLCMAPVAPRAMGLVPLLEEIRMPEPQNPKLRVFRRSVGRSEAVVSRVAAPLQAQFAASSPESAVPPNDVASTSKRCGDRVTDSPDIVIRQCQ